MTLTENRPSAGIIAQIVPLGLPPDKLKILGILNHDWTHEDGGGFIYEDKQWDMKSTDFIVFNSRNQHSNAIVFSDKKRLAIDYLVSKRIVSEND